MARALNEDRLPYDVPEQEVGRSAAQRHTDRIIFGEHIAAFALLNAMAAYLKATSWPALPWDYWVPLGWGAALVVHGLWAFGKLRS
jgi:hypothetical protein